MTENITTPDPEYLDDEIYEGPPDDLDRGDPEVQDDEAEEN